MLPMSARIWAALVEAEDLRKEIVRSSAVRRCGAVLQKRWISLGDDWDLPSG